VAIPELKDRVAVITGAGRGIGPALASAFAAEGAQVVAVSCTKAELESLGVPNRVCNVADAGQVTDLADWLEQQHGRVDVLVNNGGLRMIHVGSRGGYKTSVEELPIEDWDRMLAVNLRGPFLTCKLLLPLLRRAGRASVINISAGGGAAGEPGRAPYCASKFGLEALTQCLAAEWRPYNIAVNSLAPGVSVLTDEIKREMRRKDPSLKHASPDMMAPPALFLAQQDASGVTGQRIVAWDWLREHDLGGWERWLAE
jgi:3-oxoacyl-[acyl-carrier protein] reductase